jgi:hypothetical protein
MGRSASATFEKARPDPERDRLIGDGNSLALRIRPNGTKTWIIEYLHQGQRTKTTIGVYSLGGHPDPNAGIEAWLRYGQLSLTQARTIASHWKDTRRAGRDPYAEWQALLLAEREAAQAALQRQAEQTAEQEQEQRRPTLATVAAAFYESHLKGKKSAEATRYRIQRILEYLGDCQIHRITRQAVTEALEQIAAGKRAGQPSKQMAGEVLTVTKAVFRFAASREWIDDSVIEPLKRQDFDARPRKRETALRMDELAKLWIALDTATADPITVAAIRLLILTGQRETEVCGATWQEIDFETNVWRIPAERTKKRKAHLVHLAPRLSPFWNLSSR